MLNDFTFSQVHSSKGVKEVYEAPKIEDVLLKNDTLVVWVKASVVVLNTRQNFWYMSCNQCNRRTTSAVDKTFNCNYCNSNTSVAIPRCRIQVQLNDSTAFLQATIFGDQVEQLLSCTARRRLMNETDKVCQSHLLNMQPNECYFFQLKQDTYRHDNDSKKNLQCQGGSNISQSCRKSVWKKKNVIIPFSGAHIVEFFCVLKFNNLVRFFGSLLTPPVFSPNYQLRAVTAHRKLVNHKEGEIKCHVKLGDQFFFCTPTHYSFLPTNTPILDSTISSATSFLSTHKRQHLYNSRTKSALFCSF